MRPFAHWSDTSKHLEHHHSSKDASLITEAVQIGIRAGRLPLFDCLSAWGGPALMQKEAVEGTETQPLY